MALADPTRRNLKQQVTYWAPLADNEFGVEAFATPVLASGRWEDRADLVRDGRGDEFTSKAVIFMDRKVANEGYLVIGSYTGYPDPRNLPAGVEAFEIKAVVVVPDLRNLSEEIRAYL